MVAFGQSGQVRDFPQNRYTKVAYSEELGEWASEGKDFCEKPSEAPGGGPGPHPKHLEIRLCPQSLTWWGKLPLRPLSSLETWPYRLYKKLVQKSIGKIPE